MRRVVFTLIFISIFLFPQIGSADIVFQALNETSQIGFGRNPNLEIQNAEVWINTTSKSLKAIFLIRSNEPEAIRSNVYLRASGESCYHHKCQPDQFIETYIQARYKKAMADNNCKWMQQVNTGIVDWDNYYSCNLYTGDYETPNGTFQISGEFKIYPNDTFIIYVEQHHINFPFRYYLDSLSTFSRADHEKITIYGENISVEFNEKYPANKVSENEWIWEYSNINTSDKNLNDILLISKLDSSEMGSKKTFFQKIMDWLRGFFK